MRQAPTVSLKTSRRWPAAILLGFAFFVSTHCQRRPGSGGSSDGSEQYQVVWISAAVPEKIRIGHPIQVPVVFRNQGSRPLSNERLRISYHWSLLADPSHFVEWDGKRTAIVNSVPPGEVQQVEMIVIPPTTPGRYLLQIDLVREGVTWFAAKGTARLPREVDVE